MVSRRGHAILASDRDGSGHCDTGREHSMGSEERRRGSAGGDSNGAGPSIVFGLIGVDISLILPFLVHVKGRGGNGGTAFQEPRRNRSRNTETAIWVVGLSMPQMLTRGSLRSGSIWMK